MKVIVLGAGYVGLVSAACFSEIGAQVTCVDTNVSKIKKLHDGEITIYEPGLQEIVSRNTSAGRLRFVSSLNECAQADIVFIAVGTPQSSDGSPDLNYVLDAAASVGRWMQSYTVVAVKSTVPVGTSSRVRQVIEEQIAFRGADIDFDMASNPEFLKEGDAVNDFMRPDRVVVGVETTRARDIMERLYKPFTVKSYRIIFTDIASAEMIKYAANAMLATRISFMNEIAGLCELTGADINMVRKGIGSDTRIGNKFLYAGVGYGGSCFPKDINALICEGNDLGHEMKILKSVREVNERQKTVLFDKLADQFPGDLSGRTIGIWGISFKPETDDIREAPSLALIEKLLEARCVVKVYDPVAMCEGTKQLGKRVWWCEDMYEAVNGAYALMLVTEWKQFRLPDWSKIAQLMKEKVIFDGRNIYDRREVESHGFTYYKIG